MADTARETPGKAERRKRILFGKTALDSENICVIRAFYCARKFCRPACTTWILSRWDRRYSVALYFLLSHVAFCLVFLHLEHKLFLLYLLFSMSGCAMSFFILFCSFPLIFGAQFVFPLWRGTPCRILWVRDTRHNLCSARLPCGIERHPSRDFSAVPRQPENTGQKRANALIFNFMYDKINA